MIKPLSSRRPAWKLVTLLLSLHIGLTGCGKDEAKTQTGSNLANNTSQAKITLVADKPEPAAPANPLAAKNVEVLPGFQVELLYQTDKPAQGSWVALCNGPNGTLYATDQYNVQGQALYQIKPPAIGDPNGKVVVTPQPIKLSGAQGLYYGFGALYVMESNKGNGLMRVTDSDGDGLLDKKEQILNIYGGGEHGTHAIVPTPDGKSLYIIAGNMSPLPQNVDASKPVFKLWDEDQLLKREPDARGHASDVMAPGGWICKVDPDGKNVTLVSAGYRNAYDMAVNPNGELFTYDSDMEWDIGLPWYRPTRVNHAVSGSEFGWRNGSGKWPTYFEDSLPSAVDIGPGSPVGVLFGTGAKFPTKYQKALYILDWTYGTIYAVHLKPDGASYTGTSEAFVYGKPLPLTDAVIGADGAMYFTTGGRKGDSALYRVVYYGVNDTTAPAVEPLTDLAKLRQELETLHSPDAPAGAIALIWANLNHSDRFIRFAARVALEHQPVDRYLDKAKAEKDPMTRTAAGMALARHRHADALAVLMGVNLDPANTTLNLAWLRATGIELARAAAPHSNKEAPKPDDAVTKALLEKIAPLVKTEDAHVKVELVRMRVFLEDPTAIAFAVDLMNNMQGSEPPVWMDLAAKNDRYGEAIIAMRDNPPPIDQFNIAFMLRNSKEGWTPQTLQSYFSWLNLAMLGNGGNSYKGYVGKVREQVLKSLTEQELAWLGDLKNPPEVNPLIPVVLPRGPGRNWTTEQAAKLVEQRLQPGTRDFNRGVGLYQGATCSQCHLVDTVGGQIGPALTSVVSKFSVKDLMLHTIEPSKEVSEQYALSIVTKKDGTKVIGRVLEKTDQVVKVQPNVLDQTTVDVPMDQVASVELSPGSAMPSGLVNGMSADELADLVAFIMSKGNPKDPLFKQK